MQPASSFQLDFVIPGVQKAGTTALAQYLGQNKALFFPSGKETHYFRRSLQAEGPSQRPLSHLTRHYADAPSGALLGDATPVYLYWPFALELLHAHNRQLKLIISLRHPVARAWSAWSMEHRRGREPLPFAEAVRAGRDRVINADQGVHLIYSYVERGVYAPQIKRLLSLFDRSQIFFLRNDQIYASSPTLQKLQSFLGVPPVELTAIETNVNPSSLPPESGLDTDFDYLQSLYQADIIETAALTHLDLEDWHSPPSIAAEGGDAR